MTPDERIAQLERQIAELRQQIKALNSFATIPLTTEKAFRERITKDKQEIITDITSEFSPPFFNQSVNEGGSASYSVMTTADYALRVRLGGIYVAIPAFDY